jgi:D-amino peptidase
MKAFLSVDIEGIPHVVSKEHLNPAGKLYAEARDLMTDCLLIVLNNLRELGFESAIVADSHGPMVNILPEKLPDYAQLVRGSPRAHAMVAGAKGCDAAFFVGYHAGPGTANAIYDHIYNWGTLRTVKVNGEAASEFLLNGAVLGELGIPVLMVAGDKALLENDVLKHAPWAARAVLKESLGRFSAISPSRTKIAAILSEACRTAVKTYQDRKASLIRFNPPIELEISFVNTAFAEMAALLPNCERLGGWTVKYRAQSVLEGYGVVQVMSMAAQGIKSTTE